MRSQPKPRPVLPAVPDRPVPAKAAPREPRALVKHFRVRVFSWDDDPDLQRILVSNADPPRRWTAYLTIQHAEYVIGQLQRAIKRAPGAR